MATAAPLIQGTPLTPDLTIDPPAFYANTRRMRYPMAKQSQDFRNRLCGYREPAAVPASSPDSSTHLRKRRHRRDHRHDHGQL